MAEHELPPTRGILSLMSRLSALAPVAGAAATFGTLGAVHMAAAVLIGVLATFIAFAGLLMASDWQADAQSRHDWAEIGLTPAHLSLAVETGPASDIGFRYLATGSDEAVPRVFRANHVAAQIASNATRSTQPAEQPSSHPEWDQGRIAAAQLEAHAFEHALRPMAGAPFRVARTWNGKRRKIEIAPRLRLVANGDAWPLWTTRISPTAEGAAEVIVLSASQDDPARPQPETSVGPDRCDSTAQPACRGPPQVLARRRDTAEPAAEQPWSADAPPDDIIVSDDLGSQIPICAAELEVIETYIGHLLVDLLTSSTARRPSDKS